MKEETYKPKREMYGRRAYIGNYNGEEFFIMPIKWDCGHYWGGVYLQGLRPETEETLRENCRNVEMSEFWDTKNIPSQYLNEDKFQEDYEEEWREHADIQEEQERDGEIYYLGFGTHTHADSVLLNECQGDYKTALKKFDKLLITEEQFKELIKLLKEFYSIEEGKRDKTYLKRMERQETILQELEQFIQHFPELPNKEFWLNPEFIE